MAGGKSEDPGAAGQSRGQSTDHEQKIKDLEQKLCLQEQGAAVVKSRKSELMWLPRMEHELKRLRERENSSKAMKETNGLLTEELEGLQRRLGHQEEMLEARVGGEAACKGELGATGPDHGLESQDSREPF
jgi:hypothetical protein